MTAETTPEKAALQRAADVLGGQAAFASVLGYADRRNVWPWFNTDRRFPAEHCPLIEAATRARADAASDPALIVTCEELRPDVAWGVLREQAASTSQAEGAEHAQAAEAPENREAPEPAAWPLQAERRLSGRASDKPEAA